MTSPFQSDRNASMRAGDTDRERVAERLRHHHVDGRLDSDELQERIDACYSAKTIGELDALLADLPPEHGEEEDRWRASSVGHLLRLHPVLIALIGLALVTGHFFWLAIPFVFWAMRRSMPRCCRPRAGINRML